MSLAAPTVSARAARPGSSISLAAVVASVPSFPAEQTTRMPLLTAVFTLARCAAEMPGVPMMPRLMFITLMLLATRLATRPSMPALMSRLEPEPVLLNTFAPAQLHPGATPRSLLKPSPMASKLEA